MDIDAIYSVLQGADKQAAEEAPWASVNGFANSFGDLIMKQAAAQAGQGELSSGDWRDLLVGSLATGLIGGFTDNWNKDYRAEQGALARQVLLDAAQGKDIAAPEGMSPSIFSSVKNAGSIFSLGKQIEDRDETRKLMKDFGQKVALQGVADQSDQQKAIFAALASAKTDYQRDQVLQAAQQMGLIKGSKAEARPMVGQEAPKEQAPVELLQYGQNADGTPMIGSSAPLMTQPAEPARTSPTSGVNLSKYLNQTGGDEDMARTLAKRDLEAGDRNIGNEANFRKEFQSLPEIKSYVLSDMGYRSMVKAAADGTAQADLELTRGAIQAIEPGMAVREGEEAAARNSTSIPDAWKSQVNKALTGGSGLSDDVRQGLLRIAERRMSEYRAKFEQARSFYGQQAQRYGLSPESVTYLPEPEITPNPGSGPTLGTGAPQEQQLKELAKQFPRTPEGMAAFKAAAAKLTGAAR